MPGKHCQVLNKYNVPGVYLRYWHLLQCMLLILIEIFYSNLKTGF